MIRLLLLGTVLVLVDASGSVTASKIPGCSKDLAPPDAAACELWSESERNTAPPAQQTPARALLRGTNGEILVSPEVQH